MASEPRILFLRPAPKPFANHRVAEALARRFPHFAVDVIDIRSELNRRPFHLGATWMEALWKGGSATLRNRQTLRLALDRTQIVQDWVRRFVAQRVQTGNYQFTFQMQSLFDGSSDGLPHFVYTDHVMLENLNYPGHERWAPVQGSFLQHEQKIYRNAEKVFIRSANVARCLQMQYDVPQEKIHCVRAGPNVESIPYSEGREYDGRTILFVGLEWERKGGPVLVDAFRRVRSQHPDVRLVIVGCSPKIDEAGITVAGKQPLQAVAEYYQQASVFCLPSLREPFAISYIEAMMAGLPVVATSLGATPEIVRDQKTGLLVPPEDPEALANALLQLIGKPQTCRRMGRNARSIAESEYNWDIVAAKMAEVIQQSVQT